MSDIEHRLLAARMRAEEKAAIDTSIFQIDHFRVPASLSPFVMRIYYFQSNEDYVRDFQPAALAQLVFVLQGEGRSCFHDGHHDIVRPATVFGPGFGATQFEIAGPFRHLGLALTPLGFVALTGQAANHFADRAVDAAELFGTRIHDLALQFQAELVSGKWNLEDAIDRTAAFLLGGLRRIPASHLDLLAAVNEWISGDLDPDVEQLYSALDISRSTASRLIARYFGATPKMLMRKYRAVRAAIILVDPNTDASLRDRVQSLFYDQPHMIREIRHFIGRTPGALDGNDSKIMRLWLNSQNFRDLKAFPG